MHFYEVNGLLIRDWVREQRPRIIEIWQDNRWVPFPDVDHVLRHGRRLTDTEAHAMLDRPALPT
jgi:hypothetical protein